MPEAECVTCGKQLTGSSIDVLRLEELRHNKASVQVGIHRCRAFTEYDKEKFLGLVTYDNGVCSEDLCY